MPNEFAALLDASGITLTAVFVPFSRSRNAKEKHPSLNWQVTILQNGRAVLTTDYGAGSGHCPAYKRDLPPYEKRQMIAMECEHGKRTFCAGIGQNIHITRDPILPNVVDVLSCLLCDADVLNHSSFPEWAESCGYDPDSIKAKGVYDACLQTALTLRNHLGTELFEKLQTAAQDY